MTTLRNKSYTGSYDPWLASGIETGSEPLNYDGPVKYTNTATKQNITFPWPYTEHMAKQEKTTPEEFFGRMNMSDERVKSIVFQNQQLMLKQNVQKKLHPIKEREDLEKLMYEFFREQWASQSKNRNMAYEASLLSRTLMKDADGNEIPDSSERDRYLARQHELERMRGDQALTNPIMRPYLNRIIEQSEYFNQTQMSMAQAIQALALNPMDAHMMGGPGSGGHVPFEAGGTMALQRAEERRRMGYGASAASSTTTQSDIPVDPDASTDTELSKGLEAATSILAGTIDAAAEASGSSSDMHTPPGSPPPLEEVTPAMRAERLVNIPNVQLLFKPQTTPEEVAQALDEIQTDTGMYGAKLYDALVEMDKVVPLASISMRKGKEGDLERRQQLINTTLTSGNGKSVRQQHEPTILRGASIHGAISDINILAESQKSSMTPEKEAELAILDKSIEYEIGKQAELTSEMSQIRGRQAKEIKDLSEPEPSTSKGAGEKPRSKSAPRARPPSSGGKARGGRQIRVQKEDGTWKKTNYNYAQESDSYSHLIKAGKFKEGWGMNILQAD